MELYTKEGFDWALQNEEEFTKRTPWRVSGSLVTGNHAHRGRVA